MVKDVHVIRALELLGSFRGHEGDLVCGHHGNSAAVTDAGAGFESEEGCCFVGGGERTDGGGGLLAAEEGCAGHGAGKRCGCCCHCGGGCGSERQRERWKGVEVVRMRIARRACGNSVS